MTQRLPGTKPLDTFRAKSGRYLSVLLDGPARSEAEMEIAHLCASGPRLPSNDFRLLNNVSKDESGVSHLTKGEIALSVYSDASVLMRQHDDRTSIMFPLGVALDKWNLASAIASAFSPVRVKAGHPPLSASELAQASIADLRSMLFASECDAIRDEIFDDAERLFEARKPLGILQADPSDDPRLGFFPPLRGNPRADSGIKRNLGDLHAALQAEMQYLWDAVPIIQNGWPGLVVRGSLPDRDGTLRAPTAHLLLDEHPLDWEVASLIQPILDAYCASSSLVPDRAAVCEYKEGRKGRGALTPPGPLAAIEPTNIMVIRPQENLTAHETIEIAALRNKFRAEHADQIQACADALDIPWNHTPPAHAQHHYEDNHA